jgi:hypothetical protein
VRDQQVRQAADRSRQQEAEVDPAGQRQQRALVRRQGHRRHAGHRAHDAVAGMFQPAVNQ